MLGVTIAGGVSMRTATAAMVMLMRLGAMPSCKAWGDSSSEVGIAEFAFLKVCGSSPGLSAISIFHNSMFRAYP